MCVSCCQDLKERKADITPQIFSLSPHWLHSVHFEAKMSSACFERLKWGRKSELSIVQYEFESVEHAGNSLLLSHCRNCLRLFIHKRLSFSDQFILSYLNREKNDSCAMRFKIESKQQKMFLITNEKKYIASSQDNNI